MFWGKALYWKCFWLVFRLFCGSQCPALTVSLSTPNQAWFKESFVCKVSFVRPHEAPDFGSKSRTWSSLPRILSAPCILAVEQMHCSEVVDPTSVTGSHQQAPAQHGGTCRDHAASTVSDDSGASEATRDTAALQDGAGSSFASGSFSAAFPLKG